jgi:hypothetical protein
MCTLHVSWWRFVEASKFCMAFGADHELKISRCGVRMSPQKKISPWNVVDLLRSRCGDRIAMRYFDGSHLKLQCIKAIMECLANCT